MAIVELKTPGTKGPTFAPWDFEPDFDESGGESFRVRHLIAKLVRESIKDFNLREKESTFRFLTPAALDKGAQTGKFLSPREERQRPDEEQAIGQALQAFEDGLYLLFIDDEEKRSLEDLVSVVPSTKITLFRLTALAGL
ncbi:MAG TPA: hypothetical protein VGL56_17685 [Fimbriimonadaceae bacterium]|jgi:hypothetical protein